MFKKRRQTSNSRALLKGSQSSTFTPFFSSSSPQLLLERRAGTTETAMTAGRRGNGADLVDLKQKSKKKAGEFGIRTRILFFFSLISCGRKTKKEMRLTTRIIFYVFYVHVGGTTRPKGRKRVFLFRHISELFCFFVFFCLRVIIEVLGNSSMLMIMLYACA